MSINFGVGELKVLQNLRLSGAVVTTATVSGAPIHNLAVTSGICMIDGVTATISANADVTFTEAGATGSGLLIYAYLPVGNTLTAALAVFTAAHPANTAVNIPTAICPLSRFSFGTGADSSDAIVDWSGGSATKTLGKVQDVSISVTYENTQMRGGGDTFPVDTQHFDGVVEGNFTFSDPTATQFQLFGGIYTSGGASGTWALSGTSRPEAMSLVFQNVTDGITSTYRIHRAFLTQQTNDFTRTEFMQPAWNFMTQANNQGTVMTVEG